MGAGAKNDDSEVEETDSGVAASGTSGVAHDGLSYTPLFRAQHESRYRRQGLIRACQQAHDCNLVVLIDQVLPESVTISLRYFTGWRTVATYI